MVIMLDKIGELEAFNSKKNIYEDIAISDVGDEDYGNTVILFKSCY